MDEANVYWGQVFDPTVQNEVRVTVVATGYEKPPMQPASLGGFATPNAPLRSPAPAAPAPRQPPAPAKLGAEDVDIDVPTFLRRSTSS